MPRLRTVAVVSFMLATLAAVAACPPTDALIRGRPDAGAPGADAQPIEDAAVDAPVQRACDAAAPPAQPPSTAEGPDLAPLVFAMRRLVVGSENDAGPIGYDLDGTCTCPEEPGCTSSKKICDDGQGRDRQSSELLVGKLGEQYYADLNQRIDAGWHGTVFEISHWNGQPDDPFIELRIYRSLGTVLEDGAVTTPKWNGNDRWSIDDRTAPGGGVELMAAGYVAGNVAVARAQVLPAELLPFATGSNFDISAVILTGELVDVDGHREIANGQVTGRMAAKNLLAMFQLAVDGGTCYASDGGYYGTIKGLVCGNLDIMELPERDRTGQTCDAVSYVAGFRAVEALKGPLRKDTQQPCPFVEDDCGK